MWHTYIHACSRHYSHHYITIDITTLHRLDLLSSAPTASRHLPALPLTSVLGWAIDLNRDTCVVSSREIDPTTPKRLEDVPAYKFGLDVPAFKLGFDAVDAKKANATYKKKQKKKEE